MSSYASVKAFAARVEAELDRVDMFCANAGIATSEYEPAEGNEKTITINVISTFLLAALVMPKLKATAQTFGTRPTLTITASEVHAWTDLPQTSAEDGQIYNTLNEHAREAEAIDEYYPISKLLEVFGVRSIAEQSPAATFTVTVNCVNPGLFKLPYSN
ncbi:Short chain dehydrogenase atnD like protein [Verticillium longisporum]|nr:Short chain dehydrogenase atnD like protein [Verticillium longisporum]